MPPTLLTLPPELHHRILLCLKPSFPTRHDSISALKSLRLTSKTLSTLSTEILFSTLILFPELLAFQAAADRFNIAEYGETSVGESRRVKKLPVEEDDPRSSVSKFIALQGSEALRGLVREVVICTANEGEPESGRCSNRVSDAYRDAVAGINKFPNLSSVHIRFRPECFEAENYYNYKNEDEKFRSDVLKTVYAALDHPLPSLTSLTITNLQNINDWSIIDSPPYDALLAKLTHLHLLITTESEDAAPENDIRKTELHDFFADGLIDAYLEPTMQNLTSLSLYCTTYWGWAPLFDPRVLPLSFPHLKSLALGNWTIAHDWQIEWLSDAFGKTLETLIMDDCPIIFFIYPSDALDQQPHVTHDDHVRLPPLGNRGIGGDGDGQQDDENRRDTYWSYPTRWHTLFPLLEAGLPHLTKFIYGHGYDMDLRHTLRPCLHKNRYVVFNGAIGPSQWVELRPDGWDMEGNRWPRVVYEGFEGMSEGEEVVVKSPAVVEPPFRITKAGEGGLGGGEGRFIGFEGSGEGQTGCQLEDEKAFRRILDTVGRRARRSGALLRG